MKLEIHRLYPLMVFNPVGLAGGDFVLYEVKNAMAIGRFFLHGGEESMTVEVEKLLDPSKWVLNPVVTAGTMGEKIKHLRGTVEGLKLTVERSHTEYPPPPEKTAAQAICSCNGCGDSLKSGEHMVCAQCLEIIDLKTERAELSESRRVVRVKAAKGREKSFPRGITGIDYGLRDSDQTVLVIRVPADSVTPDQVRQLLRDVQARVPKNCTVLCVRDGMELTVLELP